MIQHSLKRYMIIQLFLANYCEYSVRYYTMTSFYIMQFKNQKALVRMI